MKTYPSLVIRRRDFLASGLYAMLSCAFPAGALAQEPGTRPVLHIIGHSHIDAAWLWPWQDSAHLVLTTFRSALDRMNETPGFCYSHSSAIHYQWVQDADPTMFKEILARIREGRWEVVGGWPVEPDCNIPATESFARHCLYGKKYCHEQLGVDVKIGFNPDSFGHAAGLPTVLSHAGFRYYVFMRPQAHEMKLPDLFWWEGPDGSRVLTYRIMGHYESRADRVRAPREQLFPAGSQHGAILLGVGDHGGAVTREQIQQVLAMQKDPNLPEIRWSTMAEFLSSIESTMNLSQLPVVHGDLQHHARGCYSANGQQKALNRRTEQKLFQAESVATIASVAYAHKYPGSRFAESWNRLLFNQFHDVLAGTSLYSDYEEVRDGIGFACDTAQEITIPAMEAIAKTVDLSEVPGAAVFAFNPLPWSRKALLEYRFQDQTDEQKAHRYTHLRAKDGTTIPLQIRPSDSMTGFYPRLSAWVDLPACGYKVFTVEQDGPEVKPVFPQFAEVAGKGFGLSSFKSTDGTELLRAPLGLVVIEDTSDTWAHGIASFRKELGRPEFVSSEIVEDGPITRVARQHLRWQNSTIYVDIAQHSGTDAIEFRFVIDWQQHEQILKFEIPTVFSSPGIVAKVPGAALRRMPDGNEEPYQDWIALEGTAGGHEHTLALINNSTYSYDCLDGLLRTILIRSAPFARHDPYPVQREGINAWQDQGRQERTFWLVRGEGDFTKLSLDRMARGLEIAAGYVTDSRHKGTASWERSMLEVSSPDVEVLAIKRAEDGDATILRMQERAGRVTSTDVVMESLSLRQSITLQPWEIRTVRIKKAASGHPTLTRTNILESI